jgi:hypothetical protein
MLLGARALFLGRARQYSIFAILFQVHCPSVIHLGTGFSLRVGNSRKLERFLFSFSCPGEGAGGDALADRQAVPWSRSL